MTCIDILSTGARLITTDEVFESRVLSRLGWIRTLGTASAVVRAVSIVLETFAVGDGVTGTGMAAWFLSGADVRVLITISEIWGEDS